MSGFLRLIGSMLLLLWIAILFFAHDIEQSIPNEYKSYSEDLINNKWYLLVASIVLSVIGSVTKVKKNKQVAKQKTKQETKQETRINKLQDSLQKIESSDPFHNISSNPRQRYGQNHRENHAQSDYETLNIASRLKKLKHDLLTEYHQKSYSAREEFINTQTGELKKLAMKVDWHPLSKGGANFKTSELKQVNSTRLEVHKSTAGKLFSAVFLIAGLSVMVLGSYAIIQEEGLGFVILVPLLFGGIFVAVGVLTIIFPRPRIFDRRYGWFWYGKKSLVREQEFMQLEQAARLSEIKAIQVINERISGNKGGSYNSWEINLVLQDGKRLNVMDHGKKSNILLDAQTLSDFLAVPLWDQS